MDVLYPEGMETLIQSPSRKELPPIPQQRGRKCILIDIINHAPDMYSRLITLIKQGVYFHVAAESLGINENTFSDWAKRGQTDLQNEEDTYYSRFFLDIRRAVASARADCEITVKEKDPKKWLTLGPGKLFGNQWAKDSPNKSDEHEETDPNTIEGAFISQEKLEDKTARTPEKTQLTVLSISDGDQDEALKVLEDAGLITVSDEYKNAQESQTRNSDKGGVDASSVQEGE